MAWSCNAPWMRGAPKPSPGHAARSRTTAAEIGTTLLDAAFSDALASLVRVRGQRLGGLPGVRSDRISRTPCRTLRQSMNARSRVRSGPVPPGMPGNGGRGVTAFLVSIIKVSLSVLHPPGEQVRRPKPPQTSAGGERVAMSAPSAFRTQCGSRRVPSLRRWSQFG